MGAPIVEFGGGTAEEGAVVEKDGFIFDGTVDAFGKADDVLYNATRGISDLITVHGLINLDFADVKTTMRNGGTALMGAATAAVST